MSDHRFELIYNEASKLFIKQGYSRTQIRDIVKKTGVSTGAIYSLFDGKIAILKYILKCTIEPEFFNAEYELPLTENQFSGLDEQLKQAFIENINKLHSHLNNKAKDYSFASMLSDAFDVISKYGFVCLFIENNPKDSGKLWDMYNDYRKKFFKIFTKYINIFIQRGEIRQLASVELSVRFMIESLSWWGMHINYDAFEILSIPVSDAKNTCIDALTKAYNS